MFLENLSLILVDTRFPENVGMAARACANMGCPNLVLVNPERRNFAKAIPPATPKGEPILANMKIFDDLQAVLNPFHYSVAATSRLGGWRRHPLTPDKMATLICEKLNSGERVALVLGSEDKGLSNEQIALCGAIVTIPTFGASSLNLAQAALILLYECARALKPARIPREPRTISLEDLYRLRNEFKKVLSALDCISEQNREYFFIQWRDIFTKARLTRGEYDALMGLCRQIKNKLGN